MGFNLLCLLLGHTFEHAQGGDHQGYCVRIVVCSRCGKQKCENLDIQHEFDEWKLDYFHCYNESIVYYGDGEHKCQKHEVRVCKNCDFRDTRCKVLSPEQFPTKKTFDREGECYRTTECPDRNCGRSFEFKVPDHIHKYGKPKYEEYDADNCIMKIRCKVCGHIEMDNSTKIPHSLIWIRTNSDKSRCTEEKRYCERCGFVSEYKSTHWFVDSYSRINVNEADGDGDPLPDRYIHNLRCKICGKMIRGRE